MFELDRVDGRVVEGQPISGRAVLQDRAGPERPPQPRDVRAERRARGVRRDVTPHNVDQPIHRHHVSTSHQQRGEHGSGLRTADVDRTVRVIDLQWPPDPETHPCPSPTGRLS